ncbi:uncharacterized protein ASCRUDRAFT_5561 [Ascoidea rubescens DSM 1968]|uniref:Serine aminopeptidase S33 domain-containing protein n=1 Tax=Ascoidea rubescens DSM 1968 TaxID=1344418 RepID=A0A1D2VPP4_9ASCO|nr:hypothetical protein ASCRUDRAFT_5561 [Ascoidea rubescens DSM 1968]ODV63593.1 hypothetical protein ASCRUDRAFT_5561 [Ascoidea rubescens DSM 1968]
MSLNYIDYKNTQYLASLKTHNLLKNEILLSINDISGILTIPPSIYNSLQLQDDNPTLTNDEIFRKLQLILPKKSQNLVYLSHGHAGHKSYCYLAITSRLLAQHLNYFAFRFDFKGCGDSKDNENHHIIGRLIEHDIDCLDILFNHFDTNFTLFNNFAIIAHSRGSIAMFKWALKFQLQNPSKPLPHLINCSGRFNSKKLAESFLSNPITKHQWETKNGIHVKCYKNGNYNFNSFVPKNETIHLSSHDMSPIKDISKDVKILSIYGSNDQIIPKNDAFTYDSVLNLDLHHNNKRHFLEWIDDADHNFYGITVINNENKSIKNPNNYPLNARSKINYNYRVAEIILNFFLQITTPQ